MYAKDTILKLREQRAPDEETGEEFPYNRVKVIGQSPVSHAGKEDNPWEGPDADGVLLEGLTNFGATLDEPFGKCKTLYEVESVPEVTVPVAQPIRVIDAQTAEAGATPEEVFAQEAPGTPPEEGQRRGRSGVSPLGEVENPARVSPLDAPPKRQEVPTPPAPPAEPDVPVPPVDPPQPEAPVE